MFKNYLKIAWRRLKSNSLFSFINIVGLALGMAVVMLIGFWIASELSFDKNFEHYDRIAQVMQTTKQNGELVTSPQVPVPLGPELRSVYGSDFKQVVMSTGSEEHVLALGPNTFLKTGRFMEPPAPEMLSLHMLEGSRAGLHDAHSILLSRSLAGVLFGTGEAMGKIIRIDDSADAQVTGIYADLPFNSSFSDMAYLAPWDLDTVLNGEMSAAGAQHNWSDNPARALVQLNPGADLNNVSRKIERVIADKPGPAGSQKEATVLLQSMSDWHLYSEFKNGKNAGGRIEYVWLFGFIGLFILLLACINFMNLSTARSGKRGREVGVRKAIGSSHGQLMGQFFIESLSVALIAFLLSLIFVLLALPAFNRFTGKEITILWQNPVFWLSCIGFAVITGLFAGSYPALYLSAFRPVTVLKGSGHGGRSASGLRKILVTVQFSISVILIIGTVVVYQQIEFARNRPVGYHRSGLVMTRLGKQDIFTHFLAFREELLQTGAVTEVSEVDQLCHRSEKYR